MTKSIKVQVAVTGYTRLNNSVNGNPRFTLHTVEHGNFQTQSDSSVGYDVSNVFGSTAGPGPVAVELEMTPANKVFGITALEGK